jgi:Tol biopolymer transport system component
MSILYGQDKTKILSADKLKILQKKELSASLSRKTKIEISKENKIAFIDNVNKSRYGKKNINLLLENGFIETIVTEKGLIGNISFSPDNKKLGYSIRKKGFSSIIKIYDFEKKDICTIIEEKDKDCSYINFAPDSKRFVYGVRVSRKEYELVISCIESKDKRIIGRGVWPKWAPNGEKIAFSKVEYDQDLQEWVNYIWILNLDNNNEERLSNSRTIGGEDISWSPEGKFISGVNRNFDKTISIINIENENRIDVGGIDAHSISWSPDGTKIVFVQPYYKTGGGLTIGDGVIKNLDIFSVNFDGTGLINLTNTIDIWEEDPVWISNSEIMVRTNENRLYIYKLGEK